MATLTQQPFEMCYKCHSIFPSSDRPDSSKPTPCCGANEGLWIWPELTVETILKVVATQDIDNDDQRKIAVLLLAAALEQLLDQAVDPLLGKHIKTPEAARILLDANEGRSRRIKLYQKLGGKTLAEILGPINLEHFINDWVALAELRNQIGHGNFFAQHLTEEKEIRLIERVYRDCLPVFAALTNTALAFFRAA
jgi:hypothetical protein